ncbi:MAG: Hpt domain-containing protein [Burkholderiales bacterium]|nr:Hpt domain-containing protein [Burkholderiales bacterium]
MDDDDLERMIGRLSAEYAEQLPDTLAQMEDLWRCVVAAEIPSLRLSELVRMAHSISGSGATFGLPQVSKTARELELFIEQLAESDRQPGPAEQEAVAALLAALRRAATQS